MQPTHVLCPLDGTPESARALPVAIDAAAALDLSLRLFSAVEDPHEIKLRTEQLDELALRHTTPAPGMLDVVVDPHAPEAIAERAAHDAFVVMATSTQPLIHHGYLGSATERVIRSLHRPVLTVGPRVTAGLVGVDRVIAPCDGSPLSELALPGAAAWARQLDRPLWIVTVLALGHADHPGVDHTYVERLSETGAFDGVDVQWDVLHGSDPARSLASWADGDLIVMTSHGRSGLSRLTLGSVAIGTARWSSGPVMIEVPEMSAGPLVGADIGLSDRSAS